MTENLLKQLRDIHYPEPISLWPLAMGWYVLFVLIGISIIAMVYQWFRYQKKHLLKKIVLHRIAELEAAPNHQHISEELSMLLKRAALATFPRQQVAGLHGEAWLAFLDKTAMTKEFTEGTGRLLIICPYQGKESPLPQSLFHLIKDWVKKNL